MVLQSSQSYETSDSLQQLENFSFVTIEKGTIHQNQQFGLQINNFYGMVNIKNEDILENKGVGISLNSQGDQMK